MVSTDLEMQTEKNLLKRKSGKCEISQTTSARGLRCVLKIPIYEIYSLSWQ